MDQVIEITIADFAIGRSPQILETKALGSCIAVCLYDPVKKMGALAHTILPHSIDDNLNILRFTDTAVPRMLEELIKEGVQLKDLEAHIVGGASMFPDLEDYLRLGDKNVEAAEMILTSHGIPIKSKEVGGHTGRSVKFF